jgi:hypothetical protein
VMPEPPSAHAKLYQTNFLQGWAKPESKIAL